MLYHRLSFTPVRPEVDPEEGTPLNYRTYPKDRYVKTKFCSKESIVAQCILYRWVRSNDYVNMAPIAELHEILFDDFSYVTKRQMGLVVHQTTRYDPKKLKGYKSLNTTVACYFFWNKLDLQYGLEWMMSIWMTELLPIKPGSTDKMIQDAVLRFLDRIAEMPLDELVEKVFNHDKILMGIREIYWPDFFDQEALEEQMEIIPKGNRAMNAPKRKLTFSGLMDAAKERVNAGR